MLQKIGLIFVLAWSNAAMAANGTVSFQGEVVQTPCGAPIGVTNVDMGQINSMPSDSPRTEIPFSIELGECLGDMPPMTVRFDGNETLGVCSGYSTINTSLSGAFLALSLYVNETSSGVDMVTLGEEIEVDYGGAARLDLIVAPLSSDCTFDGIPAGAFTATVQVTTTFI